MFAMECSNPNATKAVIGQKIARIFPATLVVDMVPHTARHTSQLQSTPLKNATPKGRETFAVAMLMTAAFMAGAPAVLAPKARYASTTEPRKLPAYENNQFRTKDFISIFLVSKPLSMTITFPVNSSAPVKITNVKPAGRPTAPRRKAHRPGLLAASAGEAPPTQDINNAPIPINAPAENPRRSVVVGGCLDFIMLALATTWGLFLVAMMSGVR